MVLKNQSLPFIAQDITFHFHISNNSAHMKTFINLFKRVERLTIIFSLNLTSHFTILITVHVDRGMLIIKV